MSTVIAVPELMEAAATDLARIGETVSAAHMTAADPTVVLLPAAADEVSGSIAHLLSDYGQEYQKLAGQAAASYEQFVQHLTASAGAYASAEAANVASLQPLTASAASTGIEGVIEGVFAAIPLATIGSAIFLGFLGILPALIVIAVLGYFIGGTILLNLTTPFSIPFLYFLSIFS